jgi:integrase/recombinase XerD
LPKLPRRLPQTVLTIEEVETVLNQPDIETLAGLRDRAMLEMLYSTAIRRMELAYLKVFDVNTRHGTVMVKQGKGAKDRVVPIGQRASAWLDKYLAEVRPELVAAHDDGTLFLTDYGESFEKNRLGDLVKRYIRGAGITAAGSCHLFRHACATHMLENGADIRYIQVMLGHSELSTTQIYTQVSIVKLREIHTATHPARLTRAESDDAIAEGSEGRLDAIDERQALWDALDGEAEDDASNDDNEAP